MKKVQRATILLVVVCLAVAVFALKNQNKSETPAKKQDVKVEADSPVQQQDLKVKADSPPVQQDVKIEAAAPKQAPAKKAEKRLPKLVDLGAGKCIPCKMMAPILEELKKEFEGRLDVVFIDVWENRDEAEKYGIQAIPTQIFYTADGKEMFRHEGFFSKDEILAKWRALGVDLKK